MSILSIEEKPHHRLTNTNMLRLIGYAIMERWIRNFLVRGIRAPRALRYTRPRHVSSRMLRLPFCTGVRGVRLEAITHKLQF
jgi:hypothetical protein